MWTRLKARIYRSWLAELDRAMNANQHAPTIILLLIGCCGAALFGAPKLPPIEYPPLDTRCRCAAGGCDHKELAHAEENTKI